MQAVRFVELAQVMDSISPKELTTAKDIRLNVGLVNDLNAVNKELAEAVEKLNAKRREALKPLQEEYKEKSKDLSEEDVKKLSTELDAKFLIENKEWLEAEQKVVNELGEKEITVELGDDKFEKLKEWFIKFGQEKYTNKKILVELLDVLGIE